MITDFLQTTRSRDDLATALAVLREFKAHEAVDEWLGISFMAWAKLEQLEEFLDHLVNHAPLADDTLTYMAAGLPKDPPDA